MRLRNLLLALSFFSFALFIFLTFLVSQEFWHQFDFDFMVKLQNQVPKNWDLFLSAFSYLGESEVTIGVAIIFSLVSFFSKNFWAALGWLGIIPATLIEVLGKLIIYHPSPSVEFLRTLKITNLPSLYIQTEFSYPSGHVTRTSFLVICALLVVLFSWKKGSGKLITAAALLGFAILMIFSRISLGEHWFSDVLGGLFLGSAAGFFSSTLILNKKYLKS